MDGHAMMIGSITDVLMGRSALVTGITENDDGSLRVYVGARYLGRYCIIDDPDAAQEVCRAWADVTQKLFISAPPPDRIFCDA
jgi:hypothetical protein